jgi:hypothetical protein
MAQVIPMLLVLSLQPCISRDPRKYCDEAMRFYSAEEEGCEQIGSLTDKEAMYHALQVIHTVRDNSKDSDAAFPILAPVLISRHS